MSKQLLSSLLSIFVIFSMLITPISASAQTQKEPARKEMSPNTPDATQDWWAAAQKQGEQYENIDRYQGVNGLSPTPDWVAEGNQAYSNLGVSVASAGDVNGDGYDDVIVGVPNYENGQSAEGAAFVYYGSASGLPATPSWMAESNQAGGYFGASAAGAGDVNGDGYDDIIIAARAFDNGQENEGAAFIWYGSAAGLGPSGTPANADWKAEGNQSGAYFGHSVACAGDLNDDGYDDIIVGAYYYDNGQTDEGAAFVWFGSAQGLGENGTPANADWMAESNQTGSRFGWSAASAGDVNGDGYDDIVIGAYQYENSQPYEGGAWVWYGSASGLGANGTPANADWMAAGNQPEARLGSSVASAGDVNGDGYDDILIGAVSYTNGELTEGASFIYYGSATGLSTTADWMAESNQTEAAFGASVAPAGDVNGDSFDDIIVGAAIYDNGQIDEGAAFAWHGSASGLGGNGTPANADWMVESDQSLSYFGQPVACAGDINGDGVDDVIVGAPAFTNGEMSEGAAFLYLGESQLTVQFSSATYSVNEDGETAWIDVTLSSTSPLTVTVNYAASDGTAQAGSDYSPASGILIFSPGPTLQSFSVPIIDDLIGEPDETINLALTNPNGAVLGSPDTAVLTILDNDPAIEVTPQALTAELCPDAQTSQILQICNAGSQPLDWEISETPYIDNMLGNTSAGLEYYSSRADFDSDFPGLLVEAFENGICLDDSLWQVIPHPLDRDSSNICFEPGDILPGIRFLTTMDWPSDDELLIARKDYLGDRSTMLLTTWSGDSLHIIFDPPVAKAGMDLSHFLFGYDYCNLDIYGVSGLLGSTTTACTQFGAFWGVASDTDLISKIVVTNPGNGWEGVDNVAFGGSLYDLYWISESPISGTLTAGGCEDLDVSFDSNMMDAGDYNGILVITSNDPLESEFTIPVTMTVLAAPTIQDVAISMNNLHVDFNSTVTGTLPITYAWDFGDGGSSNIEDPSHTYAIGGTYTYSLETSNICGVDTWTDSVFTCEAVHNADFSWQPPNPILGQTASFTATAEGTAPFTFTWDFGDGGTGTGPYASHTYTAPGTYSVTLLTANGCGQAAAQHTIVVGAPDIEVSPTSLYQELCPDTNAAQQLTICNPGTSLLTWELDEIAGRGTLGAAPIPVRQTAPGMTNNPFAFPYVESKSHINGNPVLIVEDDLPWYRWSTPNILTANGIAYDMIGSGEMAAVDLAPYSLVIVASAQSDAFYTAWNANFSKFDAYAASGGALWIGTATSTTGLTNPLLPGGVSLNDEIYAQYGNVAVPSHPWVAGVSSPFEGLWASHGELSNLPLDAIVVTTSATSGNPTLVDYPYGAGRVLVTTLTLEIGWDYGWTEGLILQNSLLDLFTWSTADIPWVDETPTSGSVPAGECSTVDVLYDSTRLTTGNYYGGLLISSSDPDEPEITIPVTMTVLAPPAVLDVSTTINNLQVEFNSTVTGTLPITYQWDFGDGGTANVEDPSHTYTAGGVYTYTLEASNICGLDFWTDSLTVCDPVHDADFSWSPLNPLINQTAAFTATASGSAPFNYMWDFGDGTTGTGQNISHSFDNSGAFTVTLTVSNGCGQAVVQHTITVVVPDIEVTAPPLETTLCPAATDSLSFTICNVGTAPLSWNLGENPPAGWLSVDPTDGIIQPAGCVDVAVQFDSTGLTPQVYTTSLLITSDDPDQTQIELPVSLAVLSPADITDISYTIDNLEVSFDATVVGELPLTYNWLFGDDGTADIEDPTHIYSQGGSYDYSLTAGNICGTDSWTGTVAVCDPVTSAEFSWSPLNPVIGQTISFTGTVEGWDAPFTYSWDWGDGTTGSGENAAHTYTTPHTYQVTLTVTNECGQSTAEHMVVVAGLPDIQIEPSTIGASIYTNQTFTDVFTITNHGTAWLMYSVIESAPWLSLDVEIGSLAPGQSQVITATFDSTDLAPFVYSYDIVVTSNDPDQPILTIPATLAVLEPITYTYYIPICLAPFGGPGPGQYAKGR